LFSLAMSVTHSRSAAEDAVHEAFVRLLSRGRPQAGREVAYVYRAVRNAAIDALRKRTPAVLDASPDALFDGSHRDVADEAADREQSERLSRAVEALADEQRHVVMMRVFGELSFREIAEALDEPLQTVVSRYRRALAVLRHNNET